MSNSSFSTKLPNLQLAWDSTSLGALKTCPRYYQLSIIEGYTGRTTNVHLAFGQHYHKALERYDHARCEGATFEEAQLEAVNQALSDTWDAARNRPWDSEHPNKNRMTLVRSVVWYLEEFRNDPIETVKLKSGKPAVELSFRWATDYSSLGTGESFLYCGHLDRLGQFQGGTYVCDRKTSRHLVDQRFIDGFSPSNQFAGYCLSANLTFSVPVKGIIVDGAQIAVTFTRFHRGLIEYSTSQLEEWYKGLGFWFAQAEFFARQAYWPMNEMSCNNYGGCPFKGICSLPPEQRQQWLENSFTKRTWDPLQVRGDI